MGARPLRNSNPIPAMSTLDRVAPAYILRHRKGGYYCRATDHFTATKEKASAVSKQKAASLLASYEDGTLTVTPVAGKPLVR